jgi:hypothetical protein
VLSEYHNRNQNYAKDQILDVAPSIAEFLQNDAPGCFEVLGDHSKALDAPPLNKMVGSPDFKKMTVAELKDELRGRNLPVRGSKKQLIARLEDGS